MAQPVRQCSVAWTAALQVAGTTGLRTYISGTATDIPVTTRFDNFAVVPVP